MLSFHTTHGQDLSGHRWQDRLVLLLANEIDNPMLARQLEVFQKEQEGLEERKLVIYQVLPEHYRTGLSDEEHWKKADRLYNRYRSGEYSFEFILIGLDGGVKLRRQAVVSCEELFTLIDGMPMRRAEMRKRGRYR